MTPEIGVLVVGGGAAGVAAAVASARAGADTVLVERYGSLGGTLTSVGLGSLCGYYAIADDRPVPVVGGLAMEVVDRLATRDGVTGPLRWLRTASLPYDMFTMSLVLDELVEEPQLEVLLHSYVTEVRCSGPGRVEAVRVESKGGSEWLRPDLVIDCTGDADIVARAGLPFDYDPEELQSATAMFRFGGVDTERTSRISREQYHEYLGEAVRSGLALPRTAGGMYSVRPGVVHANITKIPSPFDPLSPRDLTKGEVLGRRQVAAYLEAFRRFVPGFEHAFVIDVGHALGIRESRRVIGRAIVTEEHIRSRSRWDDAIACSAWPVEDHVPGADVEWVWLEDGDYYQVPFGSLVPQGSQNVLTAGRCVSATHRAQASLRVSAQCFAMGEAAGTAAAQTQWHTGPALTVDEIDVSALQKDLVAAGGFLGAPFGPERLTSTDAGSAR
jgi:hypothetical protein